MAGRPAADHPAADHPADGSADPNAWRSRAVAAFGVRVLAIGVPIVLGSVTARLVAMSFGASAPTWFVATAALVSATVVATLSARLGARLLPLAVLLKMTMIFPDRAPSRIKVARRATSRDELRRGLTAKGQDARETAVTLLALVTALGRHDRKTRGHSERVRLYCDLLGAELGLRDTDRGKLRWVGLIHDIGKLEVAAAILNKPGKLDENEWTAVRAHPDHGAKLAEPLAEWLGPWYDGIRQHHERFDGTGYPLGLSGHEISLAGRAVSVVDAFETMTAARSYKSPMPTAEARAELTRCAGTHFDPAMVRAFLAIALPRLLWAMGPITFLINIPFLKWLPAATVRSVEVAAVGMNTASTAVGATAMSVAVVAAQSPSIAHAHDHAVASEQAHVVQATHSHSHSHSPTVPGNSPSFVVAPSASGRAVPAAAHTPPSSSTSRSTRSVNPHASTAHMPNPDSSTAHSPNPNSTKRNSNSPNPNSTASRAKSPNPNSTRSNSSSPNPNSTMSRSNSPNPNSTTSKGNGSGSDDHGGTASTESSSGHGGDGHGKRKGRASSD